MSTITAQTVNDTISHWFEEQIRCGDIARYTPAHNQAVDALTNLKSRIDALFAADEAAPAAETPAGDSAEPQE